MQNTKADMHLASMQLPSKYSVFKRVANLALVVVASIICINLWLINTEHASNWYNKQANQLGASLSALSAKVLTESILVENTQRLQLQLQFIAQDPHVLGASLYDAKGRQLAENQTASSVVAAYKIEEVAPLVFVQPIKHEDKLIGYLRIMLKEPEIMAYHSEYQTQLKQQMLVLMFLAAVAGILLARMFYKLWYQHKLSRAHDN